MNEKIFESIFLNIQFMNKEMFDYNYYPLINKPTRISKDKCSAIDHIWTNVIGAQIRSAILAHEVADHLLILALLY